MMKNSLFLIKKQYELKLICIVYSYALFLGKENARGPD